MNLEGLTPAPWSICSDLNRQHLVMGAPDSRGYQSVPAQCHGGNNPLADAEFIALARCAFDVMMRRGWSAALHNGRWLVCSTNDSENMVEKFKHRISERWHQADPFTALVEADRWCKANVEKQ